MCCVRNIYIHVDTEELLKCVTVRVILLVCVCVCVISYYM